MTPTKDQKAGLITDAAIEAAAQDIVAKIVERENGILCPCDYHITMFDELVTAGALWMQALMEKLIEQREMAAWEARERYMVMSNIHPSQQFEEWKKTQ